MHTVSRGGDREGEEGNRGIGKDKSPTRLCVGRKDERIQELETDIKRLETDINGHEIKSAWTHCPLAGIELTRVGLIERFGGCPTVGHDR